MELDKYTAEIYRCIHCGYCREMYRSADGTYGICPVGRKKGFDSYYARGRMLIAKGLYEGYIKPDNSLAHRLASCTICGNCEAHCPAEISHTAIVEAFRSDLVKSGVPLLAPHREMVRYINAEYNPYTEPHSRRLEWLGNTDLSKKAEVVYFVGCTSSYRRQEIARATLETLRKIGSKFTILKDERCCGSPLLRIGERNLPRDLARHNVRQISETGASTVIFSCAGCYRTFKKDYPGIVERMNFDTFHVSEYLSKALGDTKLKQNPLGITRITYHDPCHLGRHLKVYDAPRMVLAYLPKVSLTEMKTNRANAFCCGAGGGFRKAFPNLSIDIAKDRVAEAELTGAQALISSCPFCKTSLSLAADQIQSTIRVLDLTELLNISLDSKSL